MDEFRSSKDSYTTIQRSSTVASRRLLEEVLVSEPKDVLRILINLAQDRSGRVHKTDPYYANFGEYADLWRVKLLDEADDRLLVSSHTIFACNRTGFVRISLQSR